MTQDLSEIFVGDSEMAGRMRRHPWAETPLGPPEHWPHALKAALRILLTSRFEMWMGWGPNIVVFYNDAYRPTLGIKHPRALGQPMRELWAEVYEDVRDRVESVYLYGRATWDRALLLLLRRSGYPEETYHTFSYSPLLGDTGCVDGLFCTVTEETERVLGERRLAVLSAMSAGLSGCDTRGTALQVVERVLASAARDLPFVLIYLFDRQGRAQLACAVGVAAGHRLAEPSRWQPGRILAGATELSVALEAHADMPCGPWSQPATQATVCALAGPGGRPAGLMVAGLNPYRPGDRLVLDFVRLLAGQIAASLASADAYESERRRGAALVQAVQARTAERDRLHQLFRQAPSFMCVLRGADYTYEFCNESYQQLVGHRAQPGRPLGKALPELADQGFLQLLDEVRRSGMPYVGRGARVLLQRRPGDALEERFVNFVFQPLFADDGSVDGIFAEGSDVTEQLQAENALREFNSSLETRIAERTQELASALEQLRRESAEREAAQQALRQAQKMEAVGQLTGGIAHDFNNFLQGIVGALDLVNRRLDQGRTQELRRHLDDAGLMARKAAALTHRLLAFARRQPLAPQPLDANPLIRSMEALIRRSLGEQLTLRLALADSLWPALCDANQLESAVLNLCLNGRDAMSDGGQLGIATRNVTLPDGVVPLRAGMVPGDYVEICVSDQGAGMTPDVLERAFDPFFTTKPLGQGTGLGLSMVYGFARQSDGDVSIQSAPGRGTAVRLYLPRHLPGPATSAPDAQPDALVPDGGGQTVLVVEDETVVRELVVELLQELGYRTLEAADGPAGLELLLGDRAIDLLVTDIGLPGLNGRQMADAGRVRRPGLKVLMMTGYADNALASHEALEPGMELLTKPFALDELAARVHAMLRL